MVELALRVPQSVVEAVSDALMDDLGALSVAVEDWDADSDAEQALFGEPGMPAPGPGWRRSHIKALFASADAALQAASWLKAQDEDGDLHVADLTEVPDQDWVRLTQSQFAPVAITDDFWIVPSWHQAPVQAQQVIRLDPGLAFGTGTHPTTRLCLRWIAAQDAQRRARWQRVLDYGCGSGILAIGAALHGAQGIDAVDIDPAAVGATVDNARVNGVALNAGLPETAQGAYALVLANILATPLTLLAPLLCAHVAPGGDLVLAGILERQVDDLTRAYAPWCQLSVHGQEDGWVLMCARVD